MGINYSTALYLEAELYNQFTSSPPILSTKLQPMIKATNTQANTPHPDDEAENCRKIRLRVEQTERNNKSKTYFQKLILRNCRMDQIPKLSCELLTKNEHFRKLKELDLSQMDLKSLANLPDFRFLVKLNLIMNFIADQEIKHILRFSFLEILYLSENLIRHLETVKSLSALPALKQIDLTCNPVVYDRNDLFRTMNLKIIDRYTITGLDLERNRLFNNNDQNDSSQQGQGLSEEAVSDDQDKSQELYEESDIILQSEDSEERNQQPDWESQSQNCSSASSKQNDDFSSQEKVDKKVPMNQIINQQVLKKLPQKKAWEKIFDNLI